MEDSIVQFNPNSHTFAHGAIVSTGGQAVRYLVQLLGLIIYSRLLSPSDFGLVAMVTAISGIAMLFGNFGLSLAALQTDSISYRQQSNLFWVNTAIGFTSTMVVFYGAPVLTFIYSDTRVTQIAQAISIIFVVDAMSAQFKVQINRKLGFLKLTVIDVAPQMLGLILGIIFCALGYGYWALVLSQIAIETTGLLLAIWLSKWMPTWPTKHTNIKSFLKFGLNTSVLQLINYISSNIDTVCLGIFHSATTLGYYNRAFQISAVPIRQIASPLTRVIIPLLAPLRHSPDAFQVKAARLAQLLSGVLLVPLSLVMILAHPVLLIVLGPKWGEATMPLQILTAASAFQAISFVYYWVLLAMAKTGVLFWSEFIPRVIMCALIVVLAPHGISMVAVAVLIGQACMWITGLVYAMPTVGIPIASLLKSTWRSSLFFGLATFLTFYLSSFFNFQVLSPLKELCVQSAAWVLLAGTFLLFPAPRRFISDITNLITHRNSK